MDEDDFIRAIVAAPADDAPRRAFAAWLTARGDQRGEFITLQLRPEDDWPAQRAAAEIRREHGDQWAPPVPGMAGVTWLRGFLTSAHFHGEDFIAGAEALFARHPLLEAIGLQGALDVDVARSMAALPQLSRLKGLWFGEMTGEAFAALVASPFLAGLEELTGYGAPLGDAGAKALAAASLRRLRRLIMRRCQIGPEGVASLATSPVLAPLVELSLAENPVGAGAQALAQSGQLERLVTLTLSSCGLKGEAAAALADAVSLGALQVLDLSENPLGDDGATAIAVGRGLPNLARLDLSSAQVWDRGAIALAGTTSLGRLRHLDLRSNYIQASGAEGLAASPGLAGLETLGLSGNLIEVPGEIEVWKDWDGSIAGHGPLMADRDWLQAAYGQRFKIE